MQVSLETIEGLKRRLTISVPAEQLKSAYDSRVNKLTKTMRMDGFRPGKVPRSVIEKKYAAAVTQEVAGELIQKTLEEAIEEKALKVAGYPNVDLENKTLLVGQPLEYKAEFEVFPEITLSDFTGVAITKSLADISDVDVEKAIESVRKQSATWKTVELAAKDGDRVTINFIGKMDGKEFEGGSAEDVPLVIGSKSMIPGFEEGIVGLKAGDEKTLELTFPENYSHKEYAGKSATFDVKVKEVQTSELPPIDDDFLKRFNVDTAEKLHEEMKQNLKRECEQLIKNKVKQRVIDKLVEMHTFDLPQALIKSEIDRQKRQTIQQFGGGQGFDQNELLKSLPDDMFKEQAEKSARIGLLLSEVIKANGTKADPEKVRAYIENLAKAYDDPEQAISWYYGQEQALNQVENMVLEEQLIEDLLEKATVTEETVTFEELQAKE